MLQVKVAHVWPVFWHLDGENQSVKRMVRYWLELTTSTRVFGYLRLDLKVGEYNQLRSQLGKVCFELVSVRVV